MAKSYMTDQKDANGRDSGSSAATTKAVREVKTKSRTASKVSIAVSGREHRYLRRGQSFESMRQAGCVHAARVWQARALRGCELVRDFARISVHDAHLLTVEESTR
jgi:hypothetical protein